MNVALDARWIFEEISGIGAYTRELIAALRRLESAPRCLLLFASAALRDRTLAETATGSGNDMETLVLPYGVFAPRSQWRLPGVLKRHAIDVYHSTNYMIPFPAFPRSRRGRTKCVVTIHDLIPLKFPEFTPRSRKRRLFPLYRRLMVEVGRRANAIVADSEASRRDVIELLRPPGDAERRVRAIHCGVAARFKPPDAGRRPPGADASAPRRVLYVGRADPYKNLDGLVRAFAQARRESLPGARLVIAGPPDARYPEPERLAAELQLRDAVEWTGYLEEDQLVRAYQEADLLVLPSRYEGFGLPVIEAMACGTPVVCSNRGSLPEVAADAAILVDPDDTAELARRMVAVLTDASLWRRLSAAGIAHARRFSWRHTAEQTLAVYRDVVGTDATA